ncbi:MAG: hypothetical protein V3R99_13745 [Thermoguttaceae bacterium]
MTRRTVILLLGLLLSAGTFAPAVSHAMPPPPEILGIRVGFGGVYKVGVWTPVEVLGDVSRIIVPDGDGIPSQVTGGYVRFGRVDSQLTVEAEGGGQGIARKVFSSKADADVTGFGLHYRPAIGAARQLIVAVAPDPIGLEAAIGLLRQDEAERPVAVRLPDCSQLPDRWYGYEGVDVLVLSTSRPEAFADLKPDDARLEAIDQWIRMGGKLILSVGSQAETVLAEGAPLARFAPGRLNAMVPLRDTQMGALESFVLSSLPVPRVEGAFEVPQLTDVRGIVEVREADSMPLVIRTPRGFGQVIFLAADLDREPLSKWADRPELVTRLIEPPVVPSDDSSESSAVMQPGYRDMAGHLRSAMDRYDGVWMMPFWGVAVLIVVYLLLIGPCDYLFLRRIGRMRWTWITFPTVVVAFCLGAYGLAHYLKGDRVRINQVDLVDVDMTSKLVRGTSWFSVFSPKSQTYDLTFRPNPDVLARPGTPDTRVLLGWFGLPGTALGGMNPQAISPVAYSQSYEFSPQLDQISDMPIPVGSTKCLTARWQAKVGAGIDADLTGQQQSLSGTITSGLTFPLTDCLLAFDRWVYRIDTIEPGKPVRIDSSVRRSELRTLLTGQHVVADTEKHSYHQESTPYDPASLDVSYILNKMMFFEAAGGRRYTKLTNGYQRFVDLSELLKTGRAVLIAAAPDGHHGAELLRDGRPLDDTKENRVTFYRFVLPVERVERPTNH